MTSKFHLVTVLAVIGIASSSALPAVAAASSTGQVSGRDWPGFSYQLNSRSAWPPKRGSTHNPTGSSARTCRTDLNSIAAARERTTMASDRSKGGAE